MNYIIVVEDDILINETEEFQEILTVLCKNWDKYEIFNGGPTLRLEGLRKKKSFDNRFSFINNSLKTTFIIYTRNSYDKILSQWN